MNQNNKCKRCEEKPISKRNNWEVCDLCEMELVIDAENNEHFGRKISAEAKRIIGLRRALQPIKFQKFFNQK